MIYGWLASKALGLAKGWWILALLAALVAGYLWLGAREEADDQRNQNIGASVQRERNVTATIQQVEKANEASENLRRDTGVARDECLRNARNPADC